MKFFILLLVGLLTVFNIYIFVENHQQILPYSFFLLLPLIGIFYGISRNWKKTDIDLLIYLNCFIVNPLADSYQFLMKGDAGVSFEVLIASFSYGIYVMIFLKEGVRFLKISVRDLPKIIGIFIATVVVSWLFLSKMSDFMYYLSAFYSIFIASAVNFGYLRDTTFKSRTIGSIGVTMIYIKELFYGYYFVVEKNSTFYVSHYVSHVIANFLIIYAVSLSLNNKESKDMAEISTP